MQTFTGPKEIFSKTFFSPFGTGSDQIHSFFPFPPPFFFFFAGTDLILYPPGFQCHLSICLLLY